MSSTVFVNSVTLTAATWFQDVDTVAYQYLTSVSGGNTITAVGPSGLGAYAAGLKFRFIPAVTNTAATTINITGASSLGARNIFSGGAALSGGELRVGVPVEITDDGTQFHITSPTLYQGTWTPSLGGSTTYTTPVIGRYTRIGRLVFITGQIAVNAIGTGSTTAISGLPFTSTSAAQVSVDAAAASATAIVSISGLIASASTTILLYSRTVASVAPALNAIFGNSANVNFSGCYEA